MLDERKRKTFDAIVWAASLLFAAILPIAASADTHRYTNDNPVYSAECGSCHIAYPPALLSSGAWRTVMSQLDSHFGTDASVGDARRAELTAYLASSAATRKGSDAPRITEARWFRKEHGEIAAATWHSRSVKSAANCEACHSQAAVGDFSERTVRIPREAAR
jgi:Dihaem cytochrome c